MRRAILVLAILPALARLGWAETVSERFGGDGKGFAHSRTLAVRITGQMPLLRFDLSALPRSAQIYHASVFCRTRGSIQPREPVQIFVAEKFAPDERPLWSGKPLRLEPPWYRSFDATEAGRRWVKEPSKNLGLAVARFDNFDARSSYLEIRYEGKPGRPPQVTGLRAVHHDGQTFLIWKELPLFRPKPEKVFWVGQFAGTDTKRHPEPGEGFAGHPRQPAVTLKTLRDLAGLSVRGKFRPREMEPIKVIKELPAIRYRVYRSRKPITAGSIRDAELVGEAAPLCAFVERMLIIITHGEYYDPYEHPESVIPTWCYHGGKPVMPGEAFYVHTPQQAGRFYYAVTVMKDGREVAGPFGTGNSLAEPVAESPQTPRPVLQYVKPNPRHKRGVEYHHAYWLAPPVANLPQQDPLRVVATLVPPVKAALGLVLSPSAGDMFFAGRPYARPESLHLLIEEDLGYGPQVGYSQGRGTLRSFAESSVDYFSERYILANVRWAMKKWPIDRARIQCSASTHFAVRHFELFRNLFLGPFALDMDRKWNPGSGSLAGMLGPADSAKTVDGHRAWDSLDLSWFLKKDPGRDIPFMACFFTQPKDGNHGAEYGWQDDPKGLAALRDARQPYLAQWGGASVAREVADGVRSLRWDRSVPAFSRCSLDNNPGNGDCDDGDPWGQINGYLFWDYDDVVDEEGRWAMTVYLVESCPEDACAVDITPRHCSRFRPKPGEKFKWTNKAVKDGSSTAPGAVEADRSGLVTLKQVTVTKGKNRIEIFR